ncbi:MAG: CPBP family intramembrane glutamic endopeptidase [Chthoniobacterales bacterium]
MSDGFMTAVAAVANALFLLGALYVYLSLARQIAARHDGPVAELGRGFGWPDAILAFGLAALFTLNAATSGQSGKVVLHSNDLIINGLVSAGLFVFVAIFLKLRGRDLNSLAGFSKLGLWRTLTTGALLLLAAYPLILVADLLTQRILGGSSSKQGIVELFNDSQTLQQRVLIIILAVAVAPIVEEFVFRFYLYGVLKRYFGRFAGLVTNSLLFAAVHAHAPSAAPLFVLGVCFTIAYEWSGSILVSMTMHALFNSLTLTALAFPDLLQP